MSSYVKLIGSAVVHLSMHLSATKLVGILCPRFEDVSSQHPAQGSKQLAFHQQYSQTAEIVRHFGRALSNIHG